MSLNQLLQSCIRPATRPFEVYQQILHNIGQCPGFTLIEPEAHCVIRTLQTHLEDSELQIYDEYEDEVIIEILI